MMQISRLVSCGADPLYVSDTYLQQLLAVKPGRAVLLEEIVWDYVNVPVSHQGIHTSTVAQLLNQIERLRQEGCGEVVLVGLSEPWLVIAEDLATCTYHCADTGIVVTY